MYDILIENCCLISMNNRNDIFDSCSIGITGSKIEAIAPKLSGGAAKVIDGSASYVMPGLINCHTHVYQSLIEGIGYDMHFNPWNIRYLIPIVSKMKPHHARISSELAAIEMIKSGTTSFSDHWYLHTDFNNIEEEADAFTRSGLRSQIIFGFLNESFAGRKNANGSGSEVLKEESELLDRAEDFVSRRHGRNLITTGLGPGSTEDVGTELFRKIIKLGRRLDVPLVTHIAGWVEIVSRSIEKYGMRDLEYAHSLGFTGDKSIAIHGVWLSDDEIELAAITGTGIAHNPVANMHLGYGIAPICRMRKAGVKVGLGSDGAASYTYDMFEIGKAAAMLQKVNNLDAEAVTAEDVLSLLTREGAGVLGLNKVTGSIEVGKQADLIMINAESPNILRGGRPAPLIAYGARSSDVINSIIGGKLVMEERKVLTLDEKSVLADAEEARADLLELGGIAVKELLDAPWPKRGASWRKLDGKISHKLLRINLTSQTATSEDIPGEMERLFAGGKALATAYLYKELKAGIDPLGADNKMIIAAGPLTGTIAPASSRFEIVTKSPLTGIYLDCNSGGHFGSELKAAGFDLAILEGVSEKPVLIFIEDDEVSFLDAAELWGLESYDTEKEVRKRLKKPDIRVLSIGPAGENLVKFACLSNDFSRNAARGGSGAVLGSKRVKAIALRGSRDIPIADLKALRRASVKAKTVIFNNPWVEGQRRYGTVRSVGVVNANGFLPTENFTKGCLDDVASIDEIAFEKRLGKVLSCSECPVACSKGYSSKNMQMEGPEYETVGLFGPNIGIDDPDLIAGFNYQCNQYGLDTISAGALIGSLLSTEIFENGTGTRAEIVADLLEKIAYRRGIGDLLAEGPAATAKEMGLEYQMPHIKGLAFPAYDPRVSPGTALAYMTADRGACHLRAWPIGRELSGLWAEDDFDGRVDFVKNQQEEKAAEESLTVCQFVYGIGLLDDVLGEMLTASTGEDWDIPRMKLSGERCWTLSRLFSCREGISRKDDYLPEKFTREGINNGPLKGKLISLDTQNYMLDRYYMLRGWTDNGIPGKELIQRLELEEWFDG